MSHLSSNARKDPSKFLQRIYCLHGTAGATTTTTAAGATTIDVDAATVADVSVQIGAGLTLEDGAGDIPDGVRVLAISGQEITVHPAVPREFAAGSTVKALPHWAFAETSDATPITACPEDPAHPTQPGSSSVYATPEIVATRLQQGSSGRSHPTLRSMVLEVAAGAEGSVDFVWPYQVTVQRIEGIFEAANTGDTLDLEAGPDTVAGYLTAPVAPGDTVINVSETVFTQGRVKPGFRLKLGTGPDPNNPTVGDDLGEVVAADAAAGTVTVETPAATALSAGPGYWALLTIASTMGMHAPSIAGTSVSTGSEFVLGVDVPANRPLRVTYHNNGAVASRAVIYMRYLI